MTHTELQGPVTAGQDSQDFPTRRNLTPAVGPNRFVRRLRAAALPVCGLVLAAAFGGGCEVKSFLDQTELTDPRREHQIARDGSARPRVQAILDDLDLGVSGTVATFGNARDVRADDLRIDVADYQIGPQDVLRVTILDYPVEGQSTTDVFVVTDTGNVNLPEVGQVRLEGQTAVQAQETIERSFVDAGILNVPNVNVLVAEANNRTFSILGNVGAPGRYLLNRSDFRLLDAFALARGGIDPDFSGEFVYVIRALETDDTSPGQQQDRQQDRRQPQRRDDGEDPLAPGNPRGDASQRRSGSVHEHADSLLPVRAATPFAPVYATQAGAAAAQPVPFEFEAPEEPEDFEIIRVPLRDLLEGQLRFNVVIRPNDTILLPTPTTGEYYMGGHVNATGVYQILPGRRVTLKQAITSARMLDPVAVPQRTQLIRRIDDQDVFVRVNLSKIFTGEEPDIYLKPNDMILVGTNLPAPFIAAFRNGFRVTYGFGFLYDRNYARPRQFNQF